MSMIIGQDKLVSKLNRFSIETFPRTVLINGPFGSGKHLLSTYIAEKLHLEMFDITDTVNNESINDILLMTVPRIYTVDLMKLSVKEQNILLKFIEEPSENVFIVLFSERLNFIIETVRNRCFIVEMATYSKRDLVALAATMNVTDERVIEISRTPGELLFFNEFATQLNDITNYCKKIFDNITIACPSNVLVIGNKLAYKDADNKFNLKCFFRILRSVSYELVLSNNHPKYCQAYQLTAELCEHLEVPHVNMQQLFENYLMSLKKILMVK